MQFFKWGVLAAVLSLTACQENDLPFEITAEDDGRTLVAVGVIDADTPRVVADALAAYPQAETLVLQFVPGSIDEDSNKIASRMIRDKGLTTVVPADGLVASGGTAMFVSGVTRTLEEGACMGVHTWWTHRGLKGARLLPDDAEHLDYLEYYRDMGIDPEFYWFGIRAADQEEFYWLTRQDISLFRLDTASAALPVPKADATLCDLRHDVTYDEYLGYTEWTGFDQGEDEVEDVLRDSPEDIIVDVSGDKHTENPGAHPPDIHTQDLQPSLQERLEAVKARRAAREAQAAAEAAQ